MIHPNNKQMLRKDKKLRNRSIVRELTPRGTARRKRRA